jgi:hypothetical protein
MTISKKILQTAGAGIFLALISAGAQAAAITLANPGFETDNAASGDVFGATGWGNFGGGTFTTDGTNGPGAFPNCCSPVANSGVNSMKLFSTSGVSQSFAATAGDTATMSGFGLNFGSDPILNSSQLFLQIGFFDANGLPAGTAAGGFSAPGFNLFDGNIIDANSPQDVWTALGVGTAPAPDNTAEVRFIVLYLGASGGAAFADDISATLTPSAIPVPAAVWLFGSGLLGLVGIARHRK